VDQNFTSKPLRVDFLMTAFFCPEKSEAAVYKSLVPECPHRFPRIFNSLQ
jgi:hypothetical protein